MLEVLIRAIKLEARISLGMQILEKKAMESDMLVNKRDNAHIQEKMEEPILFQDMNTVREKEDAPQNFMK